MEPPVFALFVVMIVLCFTTLGIAAYLIHTLNKPYYVADGRPANYYVSPQPPFIKENR